MIIDTFTSFTKRDAFDGYWDDDISPTVYIIRWVALSLVFIAAFLLLVSYFHARSRMRKGQQPLAYHRWLVKRRMQRPQAYNPHWPQQPHNMHSFYGQHQQQQQPQAYPAYDTNGQAIYPPPPVYHAQGPYGAPPAYVPPPAGQTDDSKTNYQQYTYPVNNAAGEGGSRV